MSSCTEFDHELDFCSKSIFDTLDETLGIVPFDIDSIELECTNHVVGSTCEYDLQVEVQAVEPILLPSPVLFDVQPAPTPEQKPLPENVKYAYLEDDEKLSVTISISLEAVQ